MQSGKGCESVSMFATLTSAPASEASDSEKAASGVAKFFERGSKIGGEAVIFVKTRQGTGRELQSFFRVDS
jgi:hypothetical protein